MAALRRVLLPALSALLPFLPGSALLAQRAGPCLRPLPGDSTGLFVSGSGSLCREFSADLPGSALEEPQSVAERETRPGMAFLLSLALPGLGQRAQGRGRWTAYLAAEAWAWIQYRSRRREGRDLQREYRDLAWLVARRVSSGPRQEGDWEYYETLTKYPSSGAFDEDPLTPGIQPEGDEGTYNGFIWVLAKRIYLPEDPENPTDEESPLFQEALAYYQSRAYSPNMAWDWGGNPLHQSEYVKLIRSSDENLRRATAMIGVILANHLLSGIDALVSGRLGAEGSASPLFDLALLPGPFSTHQVALQLRLPIR